MISGALLSLEIGGGDAPLRPDAIQVDPIHGDDGYRVRLQDGVPLPDGSCKEILASHVLEHIPAGRELIDAMNELHRLLVSGGVFEFLVPLVGFTTDQGGQLVASWQPYADPTHVSQWWFPESVLYYCEGSTLRPNADYGIKMWAPLQSDDLVVEGGWQGHGRLHKP